MKSPKRCSKHGLCDFQLQARTVSSMLVPRSDMSQHEGRVLVHTTPMNKSVIRWGFWVRGLRPPRFQSACASICLSPPARGKSSHVRLCMPTSRHKNQVHCTLLATSLGCKSTTTSPGCSDSDLLSNSPFPYSKHTRNLFLGSSSLNTRWARAANS